uniref:Uncharacterized protein n=1 Tax=Oryza sativa subsp. japonica TaxID=39947 RepID=Q6K664_ORYSJ|nr:hypothetical protein [Oryza sativa Japonica Group]BAD23216.1 hypothetical protein [Oryza sativa Japonica Group]
MGVGGGLAGGGATGGGRMAAGAGGGFAGGGVTGAGGGVATEERQPAASGRAGLRLYSEPPPPDPALIPYLLERRFLLSCAIFRMEYRMKDLLGTL